MLLFGWEDQRFPFRLYLAVISDVYPSVNPFVQIGYYLLIINHGIIQSDKLFGDVGLGILILLFYRLHNFILSRMFISLSLNFWTNYK